ncbi:hypothetical protein Trydic_g21358 [Trypoxylus dichotomus]
MMRESNFTDNTEMRVKPDPARLQKLVKEDNVICIFCGVEIAHWERGDSPIEEHRKHSPNCKLLQALETDALRRRPPRGEDECGCVIGGKSKVNKFESLEARFATFDDWPISMKQSGKAMAQAGFYYTGNGDKAICFSCGLGVHKWEETDDPWVEHAKWSPYCQYILKEKGQKFVQDVLNNQKNKDEDLKKSSTKNEEHTPVHEQLLCSVCKIQQRTVVSIPCKHLATCKDCNNKLVKCPICRTEEQEALEVRIP